MEQLVSRVQFLNKQNGNTDSGEKKTPLTNNERKRRHCDNLTEEQNAAIKQKDCDRKRLKRSTEVLTQVQLIEKRAKDCARQARCREKKLGKTSVPIITVFTTKQSKGKAVS